MPRKVCVITGSRAEYGLLHPVLCEIRDNPSLALQLVVTGMHLSPEFGLTYRSVEESGFSIDAKIETLLSSDTPVGVAKSVALGVAGFSDAFDRLRPDVVLVLGDRFEIFAAVQAALVARIPVAHIAGGDVTVGAVDEALRHSITKMSHLHFVTNEQSARRVRQLGENPDYIFNVGSPGIDRIKKTKYPGRAEVEESLEFPFRERNLLITFHPVTLGTASSMEEFGELLDALATFGPETGLIFTRPNADVEGRALVHELNHWVSSRENAKAFTSLGEVLYGAVIAQVDAVAGNSSSGLYEVPSFGKPTVNIGDRQKGRLQASSVISCPANRKRILEAIHASFDLDCSAVRNPYGSGEAAPEIVRILGEIPDYAALLRKNFHDLEGNV